MCQFDQLTLKQIIKIAATRSHILKLQCTKFDFDRSCAADRAGRAYSASPDSLAGFMGPASKKKKRKKREKNRNKEKV